MYIILHRNELFSMNFKSWLISMTFPGQENYFKTPWYFQVFHDHENGWFPHVEELNYFSLLCSFVLWNASIGAGLTSYYACLAASQSNYNLCQLLPFLWNVHQLVNDCWLIHGSASCMRPHGYGYNPAGERYFTWTCKTEVKVLASSATPPR